MPDSKLQSLRILVKGKGRLRSLTAVSLFNICYKKYY